MDAVGNPVLSAHTLVVDAGERRSVVGARIDNDKERDIPAWRRLQTTFLADTDLADTEAAGYPPERIDTVLCTHLHVDHTSWNTRLVAGCPLSPMHGIG